jgi:membrane-associated protease RseP (regulator of RpoE activity)
VVALNVDREVVGEIGAKGFAAVPADRREGVSRPAPPRQGYRDRLEQVFKAHGANPDRPDALDRFIEAQLFWDRAFAEALATAARRPGEPLVVGIMGSGHLTDGDGVPHQLADLGIPDSVGLLPVERGRPCRALPPGHAQAGFAVVPTREPRTPRPLLGARLEPGSDGVRIADVTAGSVAEKAGLKAGDVLREIASRPVKESRDVTTAVARQAPGTWLPVTVARHGGQIDLVAKFPPEP